MARRMICLLLGALTGCGAPPPAPSPPPAASPVIGTWRGTSTCTVRPSSCHDEVVVYHVAPGAGPDEPTVQASKIVDGEEIDMGTLSCRFAREARRLTCAFERGAFVYAIEGDRMHGTLELTDGTRFRVIEVERAR